MRLRALGFALALSIGAGAQAADRSVAFDVSARGLSLGTLQVVANEKGSNYGARVVMRGGGLVSALVKFAFDGSAKGSVTADGQVVPTAYDGTRVLRKDDRRTQMSLSGGRITGHKQTPPIPRRPFDVTHSSLRGVVDPVSATYALIMDRPVGQACGRRLDIFDGTRQFRITVGERKASGSGWQCSGVYLRVAGYPPGKMAEQTRFPFTIFYDEVDGMMKVREFRTDSIVGNAVARRR